MDHHGPNNYPNATLVVARSRSATRNIPGLAPGAFDVASPENLGSARISHERPSALPWAGRLLATPLRISPTRLHGYGLAGEAGNRQAISPMATSLLNPGMMSARVRSSEAAKGGFTCRW